jgi:hypothetical protein
MNIIWVQSITTSNIQPRICIGKSIPDRSDGLARRGVADNPHNEVLTHILGSKNELPCSSQRYNHFGYMKINFDKNNGFQF